MTTTKRALRPGYFKSQCDILNLYVTRLQTEFGGGGYAEQEWGTEGKPVRAVNHWGIGISPSTLLAWANLENFSLG